MEEIWKKTYIPIWEVSNRGNVRNIKLNKILKPYEYNGYLFVGCNPKHRVHRLVCYAFHGPAPQYATHVDHIDANKTNNSSENLRWVEFFENSTKDCMKKH